jgi:diguanylate cyclase (GGDEF)-like protein
MRARDKLNVLAFSDGLTHIANRRHFDDLLAKLAQDMHQAGKPVSVVIADIDHFKRFNDRYGHGRGDAALICVAHELERHALAAEVHACRIGGEEFAILMPGHDLAAAANLAEAIRNNIETMAMPHADGLGHVLTLSVGVAQVVIGAQGWAGQLMADADAALYAAKAAGRNQVQPRIAARVTSPRKAA